MAENVQELIVKYKADITDLTAKVTQIENNLRKVESSAANAGKKTTEAFNKSADAAKGLGNESKSIFNNFKPIGEQFADIGKQFLAAFAVEKVIEFGAESVKAFQQAELNAIQLQNAVGVNGGLQEDFDRLIEQSAEIQKISIFSDDDVQIVQKMGLQFGLTVSEIEGLIPIVTDFASATGQELQPALEAVLRGVNGQARALKQYGVSVDSTKSKSENLATIQEQLNKKFEGQAEVVGETSAGAYRKLGNQIDDVKETIGGFLSDITAGSATLLSFALNGFKPLTEEIDNAGESLFKTREELEKFQKTVSAATISALATQIERLQSADVDVTHLVGQLNKLKDANIKLEITGLTDSQLIERRKELEKLPFLLKDQSDQLKVINDEVKKRNLDYLLSEKELTKLTSDELERRRVIIEAANRETNNHTLQEAIDAIDAELQKRKEAGDKQAEELIKQRQQASQRLADIDKKLGDELLKNSGKTASELLQIEKDLASREVNIAFDTSTKTIQDRQNRDEAILNLTKIFAIKERELRAKIEQERSKQEEANISTQITQAKSTFELTTNRISTELAIRKAEIDKSFIQAGNFSQEAVKKNESDLFAIEQEFDNKRITEQKKFVDDFISLNEKLFANKKQAADNDKKNLVASLFTNVDATTGLPTPAKSAEVSEKIKQIDLDLANYQKDLSNGVNEVLLENQNAVTDGAQKGADFQKKILEDQYNHEKEIADKRKSLENEIRDTIISGTEQIITESIDRRAEEQLKSIETLRDAELSAIDEAIAANDKARKDGATSRATYEQKNKELIAQRVAAEDQAAAKIKDIKRKQFQADQIAAVSEVIIANTINAAKNFELAELYAILAAAQIAIILARPNPYAKGTKSTKSGTALVGEEGPELVVMPQGAKVLTSKKTKQHAAIVDAMIDGKLQEHITKVFIEPALIEHAKKTGAKKNAVDKSVISETVNKIYNQQEISKPIESERFNRVKETKRSITSLDTPSIPQFNNLTEILNRLQVSHTLKYVSEKQIQEKEDRMAKSIANSFLITNSGINARQLKKITREGSPMTNTRQAAKHIAEELAKVIPQQNNSPRRFS
jgi:hypothetical protein